MFTVVVKHLKSEIDEILEARGVEFHALTVNTPDGVEAAGLRVWDSEGNYRPFPRSETPEISANVFVMNEAGATVAKYIL